MLAEDEPSCDRGVTLWHVLCGAGELQKFTVS